MVPKRLVMFSAYSGLSRILVLVIDIDIVFDFLLCDVSLLINDHKNKIYD